MNLTTRNICTATLPTVAIAGGALAGYTIGNHYKGIVDSGSIQANDLKENCFVGFAITLGAVATSIFLAYCCNPSTNSTQTDSQPVSLQAVPPQADSLQNIDIL